MKEMSGKKRTPPQDWIQDYYSPVLSVLASQDAEAVAQKNNLTLTELLQPFSKLTTDVTLKDVDGTNHNVPCLNIILQDFKKDPQKVVNQKLLLDRVSEENCADSDMVTKHFERHSLDAPGFTPWFDVWMKLYLQSLPVMEQEYLKHHFGCLFVVSTAHANPVEQFRNLSQIQHRNQHDKPGSYPQYFAPNILKYYLLVHDVYSGITDAEAQALFTQVQNAFEPGSCHLLQLNSKNCSSSDVGEEIPQANSNSNNNVAENWFSFTHRFYSIEARRGKAFQPAAPASPHNNLSEETIPPEYPDHPLAIPTVPDSPTLSQPALVLSQAAPGTVAQHLNANDVDRIRLFMRDLVIKAVVPYAEKQLKQINELVTNRKSRSLFSGAKRWFGTNKPNAAGGGTSVVYSKEAPELQVRKIADLYFLMKLYKPAYNFYYIAKKDFQADEAWPHYAAAVELTALAMFMLAATDPGKKYRADYMEDAVTKYLTLCQTPEFAVRATLFDALCLKQQGLFMEAAKSYIRMTNELSDLRSAMLLEQAAYCFLLNNPPNVRKYGFHIVLAGYRFTKTGSCKRHAARLYAQGAQIYDGKGWLLSSEHILYTLGHQKFMLKDFAAAAEFFNDLMAVASGMNPLQQMVHLREFFLVHHARFKEDKVVMGVSLPKIHSQQLSISLLPAASTVATAAGEAVVAASCSTPDSLPWQPLERTIRETVSGEEILVMKKTCQPHFSSSTDNQLSPQGVAGERLLVTVPFENFFNTPLVLKRSYLLWRFTDSAADDATSTNDKLGEPSPQGGPVQAETVESVTVERGQVTRVTYAITASRKGTLNILGLEYSLGALFPDKEPTDHEIRGKQYFHVTGPKMNTVKDHKNRSVAGADSRLQISIREPQPCLALAISPPQPMLAGELRCVELELRNMGPVGAANIHLVSRTAGLLSFGRKTVGPPTAGLFEYPLVERSQPPLRLVQEDGSVSQVSLDVLPAPLSESFNGSIPPHSSIKIPVWIRGPNDPGEQLHDLFVYYESVSPEEPRFCYRLLHQCLRTRILTSLAATAQRKPVPCRETGVADNIVVHVRNTCKDFNAGLDAILITQATLVSVNSELAKIQNSATSATLTREEVATFSLQSVIKDNCQSCDIAKSLPPNQNRPLDGGRLHFSSLVVSAASGGGQQHPLHLPPFLHFLKPAFLYNIGRRTNPPFLKEDLLVLMWRSGGSQPMLGQTILPLLTAPPVPQEQSDPLEPELPPQQPLKVRTLHPAKILHDFAVSPVAGLRLTVEFSLNEQEGGEEEEEQTGVGLQFCLRDVTKGVKWTGVTAGARWLESGRATLQLGVNVSRPGLFNLRNLFYRAKRMKSWDPAALLESDCAFTGIEIEFTVMPA